MVQRTLRKDDYDPWDVYVDLEKLRLEEVRKRDAGSRNQKARGSEEMENPETSRGEIHPCGNSSESGTSGRSHDSRKGTHKEKGKLQPDGKKGKKTRWILGKDGKYRKKRRIQHGKKENNDPRGANAKDGSCKEEGKTS